MTDEVRYDAIVIGAGPAGLSFATCAAIDGFKVLLLAGTKIGGQIVNSPRFDNVIGIVGSSGQEFIDDAVWQAQHHGVTITDDIAVALTRHGERWQVDIDGGIGFLAPVVVFATGIKLSKLADKSFANLENRGVWYGRVPHEPLASGNKGDVAVVGAGNAAAQNIIYLSNRLLWSRRTIHVIVRGPHPTWSHSLDKEISKLKNVKIWTNAVPAQAVHEELVLKALKIRPPMPLVSGDKVPTEDDVVTIPNVSAIFVFVGGAPNSALAHANGVRTTPYGRIETGEHTTRSLETNLRGIFAIGDVRNGIGHGVPAAIGDGYAAAQQLWSFFADHDPARLERLWAEAPTNAAAQSLVLHPALQHPAETVPSSDETPTQSPPH